MLSRGHTVLWLPPRLIQAQPCPFLYIVQPLSCWPLSWSFPSTLPCKMMFARVPFVLTTCPISPNPLSFTLQDDVCQGSLRSHHMSNQSKPSELYSARWCLPGFPSFSPHVQSVQTIWALLCKMMFARVPFILTTCPNHLSFTLQDDVCQGSLHSHHMSKPSELYPARWCLPGFPSFSPHVQTLWALLCKMMFARVPFILTTCPNHLSFTLQDDVCQGSLHSHHMSKPSELYPARWCLPGFPSFSPHVQTIWALPCKMMFARVPFFLTTCPNHLSFTLQDDVCQGSLHSHHMSKPSELYPARWCLPGFPSFSPHVQTIWALPCKMMFARVPFILTTCPNPLSFTLQDDVCQGSLHSHHMSKPSELYPARWCLPGFPSFSPHVQTIWALLCKMMFARVPFFLTSCPNHLSFTLQDDVCQGSLHSHLMSKPSELYPARWCLPGFPSFSPHVQTIWALPCKMMFARVPFILTTCPNPLSFTLQDDVCQGSLHSHHMSKPSELYPARWCLPGFPSFSPHVQTLWALPCKMMFARVPFFLTTSPNHLSFTLQDDVCQGSLHSHHMSKPSELYPARWCLPGFPSFSPHVQTIWALPCKMMFARVPFVLTTCPNHLSFTLQDDVCQGSLHSHHMSKPSELYPARWCLPGFPSFSPHVQTIWALPCKMMFARVPFILTTCPNPLSFTLQDDVCQGSLHSHHMSKPSELYPARWCLPGFPSFSPHVQTLWALPCKMMFARVPFVLTTCPNPLSFTLQDDVCQGSLHSHHMSKPSELYPARWCLPGFPSFSPHVQTIWALPCKMMFARVPFILTTCPNPLSFTLQDDVCQGSLHSHHMSKPSELYPARWCLPGFPSFSPHVQTIWALPCKMMFARVPFILTTCPNPLSLFFLIISSSLSYFPMCPATLICISMLFVHVV